MNDINQYIRWLETICDLYTSGINESRGRLHLSSVVRAFDDHSSVKLVTNDLGLIFANYCLYTLIIDGLVYVKQAQTDQSLIVCCV